MTAVESRASQKSPSRKVLLWCAGAAVIIVLFVFLRPRIEWARTLRQRQADLAAHPWTGRHPFHLLLGDSHVELGDWDRLCSGPFGLRNCGLGRARIEDVSALAQAI